VSSIRRPGRRRPLVAAASVTAAIALTATGCAGGSQDRAGAQATPSAQAPSAQDIGIPKNLPKDLPTSLKDLDKWREGAWKHWDRHEWTRKASDFLNPYIRGHWKPERMERARDNGRPVPTHLKSGSTAGATDPAPQPVRARAVETPYTRNAAPAGKVFMDTPEGPMVCSGTVIKDPRHPGKSNLVATAGHCVHSGENGGWLRNIMFVPAYNNRGLSAEQVNHAQPQDVAPYGQFWADWAQTSNYWIQHGAHSGGRGSQQDFAVLHVRPEHPTGKSLEETVGNAVKVDFKAPRAQGFSGLSDYGYPAAPPFDGARMYACVDKPGRLTIDPSQPPLYRIGCTMTGGSSGGGWFMKGRDGQPELVSVNSIGPNPATWLAGPRLGATAKNVLDSVSGKFATTG
jgi:V8-like Glu-specific endopeptidase